MQTITITLEGGIIQDIDGIPEGVRIRVLDFDVEGMFEEDLVTLPGGQKAIESIWKGGQ